MHNINITDEEFSTILRNASINTVLAMTGNATAAQVRVGGANAAATSAYHINTFLMWCETHGISTLTEMRQVLQDEEDRNNAQH